MKAVQEHVVDMPALDQLISTSDVTLTNRSLLLSLRERTLARAPDLPRYVPCYGLHPEATSCWAAVFDKFFKISRLSLPMYSAVHVVPSILFRWNMFRADPARILARVSVGIVRSSAFLGAFAVLSQGGFGPWYRAALTSTPQRCFASSTGSTNTLWPRPRLPASASSLPNASSTC